jgi:hypothetical protein
MKVDTGIGKHHSLSRLAELFKSGFKGDRPQTCDVLVIKSHCNDRVAGLQENITHRG